MNKEMEFAWVRDEDVDEEPLFVLSWGRDDTRLEASIGRVGLVSPLVLRPLRGRYRLVCGLRRRRVLRRLGKMDLPARLLPEETSDADALVLALEENLGHRVFNDAEKALAAAALSRHFSDERILADFALRLEIPARPEILARYLALAALEPAVLNALASGKMDPETAELLAGLDSSDRAAILHLFDHLAPGRNKARKILTLLEEIGRRENLKLKDVLESPEIRAVLAAENLKRPQKEERVRDRLRRRRYPELTRLEEKRADLLKSLNLPEGVKFLGDPSFEGLEFALEMRFRDPEGFRKLAQALARLADDPDLAALLDLG